MKYIFLLIGSLSLVLGVIGIAARLPVASRAQAPGPVHTQLPRGTQHTAARKDYFVVAVVAHLAALHGADIRLVVAARRHAGRGCGRKLVHPVA